LSGFHPGKPALVADGTGDVCFGHGHRRPQITVSATKSWLVGMRILKKCLEGEYGELMGFAIRVSLIFEGGKPLDIVMERLQLLEISHETFFGRPFEEKGSILAHGLTRKRRVVTFKSRSSFPVCCFPKHDKKERGRG
jgi:hypothetical protein